MLSKLAPALLGALLATGAGLFTFGRDLGEAQARAAYWQSYSEGIAKLPAECRR